MYQIHRKLLAFQFRQSIRRLHMESHDLVLKMIRYNISVLDAHEIIRVLTQPYEANHKTNTACASVAQYNCSSIKVSKVRVQRSGIDTIKYHT